MNERKFLPYSRQAVTNEDVEAVDAVLRSDWLTTGPAVQRFERAVAEFTGSEHAVAVSSGTAALHAAVAAMNLKAGDEVIVPAITFAATANAVVYCGGIPVFVDVDPDTLLIDPRSILRRITDRTRGIIAVDYGGQPCDYDLLREICNGYNLFLLADASHALGATYKGRKVGVLADCTTLSFHPVKHITTGEGGMITTNDGERAARMRRFRNHGIDTDHKARSDAGRFRYEMVELGFNYRISDIQCALGASQLKRLPASLATRQRLAEHYNAALGPEVRPLCNAPDRSNAYHLYVVRVTGRDVMFQQLREAGIGTNVHYLPVYLHAFYKHRFGTSEGLCPVAEAVYHEILSLPLYTGMELSDAQYVAEKVNALVRSVQSESRFADRPL